MLRSWYEKNKHIFPASRWEPYDPEKKWDKYTVRALGSMAVAHIINEIFFLFYCVNVIFLVFLKMCLCGSGQWIREVGCGTMLVLPPGHNIWPTWVPLWSLKAAGDCLSFHNILCKESL